MFNIVFSYLKAVSIPINRVKKFLFFLSALTLSSYMPSNTLLAKTDDWIKYVHIDANIADGSSVDVSFLLDPPAGKHGFVKVKKDGFYFEDGLEARFWGINIVSERAFPSHAESQYIAKRLAQMGINIVRFHQLDNNSNNRLSIFGKNPESTRKLDFSVLDKFEYFWAQLKKKGIYLYINLTSNRKIQQRDLEGRFTDSSFHIQGEFIPEFIELQKIYAKSLLTHINPYTSTSLVSDPCLALIAIQNEDSLFYINQAPIFRLQSESKNILDNQYAIWTSINYGLKSSNVKVELPPHWRLGKEDVFTDKVYKFLYDTQLNYYKEITKYLRDIGVKIPIAGSNHWTHHLADLRSNSEMDFVDRHKYKSHPIGGYSIKEKCDKTPLVLDDKESIFQNLAARRILGLPYVISEWNVGLGNKYQATHQLLMSVISCLQGWNAIQFETGPLTKNKVPLHYAFSSSTHPVQSALWPISSLIFHRKELEAFTDNRYIKFDKHEALKFGQKNILLSNYEFYLLAKTGIVFDEIYSPPKNNLTNKISSNHLNNKFKWDRKRGVIKLDTNYTKAAAGFIGGKSFNFDDLIINPLTEYGIVVISSLEDKKKMISSKLLIVSVAMAKSNDNQGYPIFVKPVDTSIEFLDSYDHIRAFALSFNGKSKERIILQKNVKGNYEIHLGNKYNAIQYLIDLQ
jgi:hypothetical protein